jgi:hypothetical protein
MGNDFSEHFWELHDRLNSAVKVPFGQICASLATSICDTRSVRDLAPANHDERRARNFRNPRTAMPRPISPSEHGSGVGPTSIVPVTLKMLLPIVQV